MSRKYKRVGEGEPWIALFEPRIVKPGDPWYRKLQYVHRKIYFAVIMIAVVLMQFYPIMIPPPIEPYVWEIWNWIEELQPGDSIWFGWSYSVVMKSDSMGMYAGIITQLWSVSSRLKEQYGEGLKIFELPQMPELYTEMLQHHKRWDPYMPKNLEYGVDYVQFDFQTVGGREVMNYIRIGEDVWNSIPVDRFGTPVDELPIMQYWKTNADLDICILYHGCDQMMQAWWYMDPYPCKRTTKVLGPEYGQYAGMEVRGRPEMGHAAAHPIHLWDSGAQPVGMPMYTSGQYGGFTFGVRHCAEYESLSNYMYGYPLNIGYAQWDLAAINTSQTFIVMMWIIGNVSFLFERRMGGS
jgi:hypothetical protein